MNVHKSRAALAVAILLSACASQAADSGESNVGSGAAPAGSSGATGFGGGSPIAGASVPSASAGAAGYRPDGAGGLGGRAGVGAAIGGAGGGPSARAGAAGVPAAAGAPSVSGSAGRDAAGGAGVSGSGASGMTGAAGAPGTTGMCVTGQTKASEVLFIGDSFIAINNSIPMTVESNARAAGALGQTDRYRNNAVSGTTLASSQIPNQYTRAVNASPVKVVLMNGGGNDCLQANNPSGAYMAATSLFETMAQKNTETVIYFFYPDPLGTFGGGSLKGCLDMLRPQMKMLCEGLTKPKCYFMDLRPGWIQSHTGDGIHPTSAGGKFVGDQIWATMKERCIAQ